MELQFLTGNCQCRAVKGATMMVMHYLFLTLLILSVSSEPIHYRLAQGQQDHTAERSRDFPRAESSRSEQPRFQQRYHDASSSEGDQVDGTEAQQEAGEDGAEAYTTEQPAAKCDLCESMRLSREQLDFVHIEWAKKQILDKLRLTEAPNVTWPRPPIPPALLHEEPAPHHHQHPAAGEAHNPSEEFYAQTTQIVVVTDQVLSCGDADGRAVCFRLSFKQPLSDETVRSLKFHVYRKGNEHYTNPEVDTLELYEHNPQTHTDTFLTKEEMDISGKNWLPFKLPRRLVSFSDVTPSLSNSSEVVYYKYLKLRCSACESVDSFLDSHNIHQAYLEMKTQQPEHVTRRSTATCRDGLYGECCLVRLRVSFVELGWHNWILYPESYNANYCAGSCKGIYDNPVNQNSAVVQSVLGAPVIGSDVGNQDGAGRWRPCCSPKELAPITVILFLDGQYLTTTIPNMVVQNCGCS